MTDPVALVIERALLDDEYFGNRAADEDQLKAQAHGSAALIVEALRREAPASEGVAFKPSFIVNEPMNLIEVVFEDVAHKSRPLIEGVYHWIDQHIAFDDERVVGLTFWAYKPPSRPDAGCGVREALEDLISLCECNLYPQPDKPNSDWARVQAAKAALSTPPAAVESNASVEARLREAAMRRLTEAGPKTKRDYAREFYEGGMRCNCDLDNWEPERSTGHSQVCRIHKAAIRAALAQSEEKK